MAVMQEMVTMLVVKIQTQEINPATNQPFKLEDIKILEYKTAVQKALGTPTV